MPYKINKQTGGMDYINASTGHTLSSPAVQSVAPAPKKGGFLKSASEFLIPRTMALLKKSRAGVVLSAQTQDEEDERKKREKRIEQLIAQSKQEADPNRRSQLLGQARDLAQEGTQRIRGVIDTFEKESGTKITDKDRILAESLGVAGELGTFFVPVGKVAKAATLAQRTLKAAKVGAAVGAIHGATDPEARDLEDRVKGLLTEGGTGFLFGGAVSGGANSLRSVAKKFLGGGGGNRRALARLFRMTPSARAQFRKSTGGMDFEEEILARDGQNIAGMNYEQMLTHFGNRAKDAVSSVDNLLNNSTKTVSKKSLIASLKKQSSSLSPKKGNVGTRGTINQLDNIINDLEAIPDDQLSLSTANNIKKQLQKAGEAAFSPAGKATTTSQALASASGVVKRAIEKAEDKAKEGNRTIQLYQAAKSAIEKTGDREAAKLSNSMAQKFMQMIPAAAAGAGGIGGFAVGGPMGGIGGIALATALIGGAGAARVKYLSPEVQTALIGRFSNILNKQGMKSADAFATRLVQEISKQIARNRTLQGSESDVSDIAAIGDNVLSSLEQSQDGEIQQGDQAIQQEVTETERQGAPEQQVTDHVEDVPQTVTIVNKKTGERRVVQKGDLGQYGLASDADESIPGLPSKGELLAAMVIDLQNGGKNINKLKTILDTYDKVLGAEEEEAKLTEGQRKQLSNLSKSSDLVRRIGDEAKTIVGEDDTALRARTRGLSLKAAAKAGLISDRELQAKVSSFSKVRKGMRVQIARGLGEVGNLSEPEQKAALDLLPDITMSVDEINENIRLIEEILALAKDRVVEFSGGSTSQVNQEEEEVASFSR